MSILSFFRNVFRAKRVPPVAEWFFVEFDETHVKLRVNPPGRDSWEQRFTWTSIVRVCFKDEGLYASDGIYVFTSDRHESYVVPTEATGGDQFFGALVGRGYFPAELMSQAMRSTDGGLYCWPTVSEAS